MDTASHLLLGFTLAGLAHIDPVVAQNPDLLAAVTIGTVVGSHAPDLDSLVRLKSYNFYVRYHRGITHSIPALFIWPVLIGIPVAFGFGVAESLGTVCLWTFLALIFHVFLDMLNTYGVQSFRPFTKKWIHYDILAIFEPIIFFTHLGGVGLWLLGGYDPAIIFSVIYVLTFLYIGMRTLQHRYWLKKVPEILEMKVKCQLLPSFNWFRWYFVLEGDDCYYTGMVKGREVFMKDMYPREHKEKSEIVQATTVADGVKIFQSIAEFTHVTYQELHDGYEVRWSAVRFWYNHNLPFGVDVRLDKNLKVVDYSYGWRKKAWDPPFV